MGGPEGVPLDAPLLLFPNGLVTVSADPYAYPGRMISNKNCRLGIVY